MKSLTTALSLGFLAASIGVSQGPLYDKITVNIPYAMHVNGAVLQPGEYEIRQHQSIAGSRILHFYSDQGMKLETTAMAIPTIDNRTPSETKLVLDHYGPDYYLSKVWVQGKDYGYEFPLPENIRMRENERNLPASATVRYDTPPAPAPAVTAQSALPPAPAPAAPEVNPAPAPEPQLLAQKLLAQNEPPPPAPPVTTTPATPEMADRGPADRGPTEMPSTAGNWFALFLGGGILTSAGLVLRRFRV